MAKPCSAWARSPLDDDEEEENAAMIESAAV
jgi:hypothetical protein